MSKKETKDVVIKKIVIDLGDGSELALSPDKLMKLKKALDEVFPEEKITYIPSQPIIIKERDHWPWYPYYYDSDGSGNPPPELPYITCHYDSSNNILTMSNMQEG